MKPFDLLFIESPYEYSFFQSSAFPEELEVTQDEPGEIQEKQKRWLEIQRRFKQLGDICREHNIPIRFRNIFNVSGDPSDKSIEPHFTGCDYGGILTNDYLENINPNGLKILLSGGYFSYSGYDSPLSKKEIQDLILEQEMNPDEIENFHPEDRSRRIAIVNGCVPAAALRLQRFFDSNPPLIYIDAATTVGEFPRPDTNSVYLFQGDIGEIRTITIMSAERIDRSTLVPNS